MRSELAQTIRTLTVKGVTTTAGGNVKAKSRSTADSHVVPVPEQFGCVQQRSAGRFAAIKYAAQRAASLMTAFLQGKAF